MCFTININTSRDAIEKRFNVDASVLKDFEYRYFYRAFENPMIPVITQENRNEIQLFQWGLIPHWAKDFKQADALRKGTYNARGETISDKPSFRKSFGNKRCWIIARGFYEWQHHQKEKIPWYIHAKNYELFAFAGLYDTWYNPDEGIAMNTFSIVTTQANQLMEKIHNTKKRMPVILFENNANTWIQTPCDEKELKKLLLPYDSTQLNAYTIGKNISNASSDPNDPSVLKKIDYHIDNKLF
jgi:putative SOS response-associated peptidase YedK